jgi:hypothetical protein
MLMVLLCVSREGTGKDMPKCLNGFSINLNNIFVN